MFLPTLTHHVLSISRNPQTLAFYREVHGFELVSTTTSNLTGAGLFHLSFPPSRAKHDVREREVILELHESEDSAMTSARVGFEPPAGYWKIGLLVSDVNAYREQLLRQDIKTTEPRQFRDIGYLGHTNDPDGFRIELLQRTFESNRNRFAEHRPTLVHITLRVTDADASVDFYTRVMGMRLLSKQAVTPYEFTLYFLACTDECPPFKDINDVRNREWLWQRPYTCIELQHFWGARARAEPYETAEQTAPGFWGLGFETTDIDTCCQHLDALHYAGHKQITKKQINNTQITIRDPDGYLLRINETS